MTDEALNTAQACSPMTRPRRATLSWVTTEQTDLPLYMVSVISELTGPSWMRVISPHK